MKTYVVATWLMLPLASLGCGRGGDAVRPEGLTRRTQSGAYTVSLRFDPETPPVGTLFAVEAVVTQRDGTPLEAGTVVLDARMPQHNHGMETDPIDLPGVCPPQVADPAACPHPEGRYRTEGFKFHMPGAWTVTAEVRGARGPDSTSFVVEVL